MRLVSYLKFINRLFIAKITKRRVPLSVILCVTNRCNLNCWYCYGEHPYRKGWVDFSTKELLEIVRTLRDMGTQMLQVQGGEPLMRDDLGEVIDAARRSGMICDMVTNGILIPEKQDVVRLLDRICISLDGPAPLNDRNKGRGSHARIVEGLKSARSLGLPVRISAVLTSESTTGDIDWLIGFAGEHRALVNFSPSFDFVPRIRVDKIGPHALSDGHLRSLLGHIARRKEEGAPVQFTARSYDVAVQWPFRYGKRKAYSKEIPSGFSRPRCYHGQYVFFIDSDGGLYPCCNFWGRGKLNIRENGLRQSILEVDREGCESCYIPAYIDRNLFFDGASVVWRNYARQIMKGTR